MLGCFTDARRVVDKEGTYTNRACAEQDPYGEDIEQFGQLLAILLGHCHGSSEYTEVMACSSYFDPISYTNTCTTTTTTTTTTTATTNYYNYLIIMIIMIINFDNYDWPYWTIRENRPDTDAPWCDDMQRRFWAKGLYFLRDSLPSIP